jgi:uracil-DNA glycosylase
MSSPAKETETTVFLEDIDSNYKVHKPEDGEQSASQSSCSGPSSSQGQTKVSNKRQRTIEDMFFGGKRGNADAKKIKVSTSESNGASTGNKITVSALKSSGLQKLNSIPFSLSEFREILDEEQKRLLRLECEVMGKSWSVISSFP